MAQRALVTAALPPKEIHACCHDGGGESDHKRGKVISHQMIVSRDTQNANLCIPPAPLFSRQGFYEGVVRGPENGNGTASEMQFMVEWTPINVDGSVKVGEPIEEEIEKESIVVKANECYTRWWSCKQQESLKNEQRMEVDGEVAKELAASLAAKGRVEQMEQDTHLGDGGPEAATAVAGEPAATAAAEGRGEQVEQGTHLGDGGPETYTR